MKENKNRYFGFNKRLSGSFTIEASVIIPLSFLIIVTAILLAVFIHDSTGMDAAVVRTVNDNAGDYKTKEDIASFDMDGAAEDKAMMAVNITVNEDHKKDSIAVSAGAEFNLPFASMIGNGGSGAERVEKNMEASGLDARGEILKYKAIADGLNGIGIIKDKDGEEK